jgi:MYXO-CTERM domain-containing protein
MAQLVNSLCAVCGERISSVIDGHFCEQCRGAVHNWCARPTGTPASSNICGACGGDSTLTAVLEKKEQHERAQQAREERRMLVEDLVKPLVWWRLARFSLAGVLIIALGFCLIFSPIFRTDPKHFTLEDAAPGIGAIIAGIALLGLVVFFMWRRR